MSVQHDAELGEIFTLDGAMRRKRVSSSRGALNGYQKGRCFYCHADLQLAGDTMNADVDHFFPHKLKQLGLGIHVDGIWNLVLACPLCSRRPKVKFDRIPKQHLLERLHQRNEYLIGSHHPLRETLMQQTGLMASERIVFLSESYRKVQLSPSTTWEPDSTMM